MTSNAASPNPDAVWMTLALDLARQAESVGEVPVGAIVVRNDIILGQGFNARETQGMATRHAEMVAIDSANALLGAWRLNDCTLYVTLEPCVMCAGAIVLARIPRVVFATTDPKAGAMGSLYRIHEDTRLNHRPQVTSHILADEARELLQQFFRKRRG